MHKSYVIGVICTLFCYQSCSAQDPWHFQDNTASEEVNTDLPPDLRIDFSKKHNVNKDLGSGEWFYRRILSIIMKGGEHKENEDGSQEISLQMKLSHEKWQTLQEYTTGSTPLSEEMYRRSLNYIEQAIYRPYVATKIILSWSDYLVEYKMYVTWSLAALAALASLRWLKNNMSHNHLLTLLFFVFYTYEVFTSYKEAEKQELDMFLNAVNNCKWKFWTSSCEIPMPDPLVFIKHMNPLKICIRMFATVITEPLLTISDTLKVVVNGVTDDLWYPVNKIAYGILIVVFNALILLLIVMIVCSYILNIPFSLNFLWIGLATKQRRNDSSITVDQNHASTSSNTENRLSDATLNQFLSICSQAISTRNRQPKIKLQVHGAKDNIGMRHRKNAKCSKLSTNKTNVRINALEMSKLIKNINRDGSGDTPSTSSDQ